MGPNYAILTNIRVAETECARCGEELEIGFMLADGPVCVECILKSDPSKNVVN